LERVGQGAAHQNNSNLIKTGEDEKMNVLNATSVKPQPIQPKESVLEKLRRIDDKINSLVTRKL
jgi:hypothetical protein